MKNKGKKNNSTNERIEKIRNILDPNYFHVHIEINHKYIGGISWSIYYKNLPTQMYYSNKNKPLLTSEKNTIEDIYKLKDKFEYEKEQVIEKNFTEITKIQLNLFFSMQRIKYQFIELMTYILFVILATNISNLIFFDNQNFAILITSLTIVISILMIIKQRTISNLISTIQKEIREEYIKDKIRREGIYFIKRLKNEF